LFLSSLTHTHTTWPSTDFEGSGKPCQFSAAILSRLIGSEIATAREEAVPPFAVINLAGEGYSRAASKVDLVLQVVQM
jgi:hypothetical protein